MTHPDKFVLPEYKQMAGAKKGRGGKRSGKGRKMRMRRRNGNVKDIATLSCKTSIAAVSPNSVGGAGPFAANTLYSVMGTKLSDYPRAVQVASAYQHFKIKRIAVTFKPTYDTYAVGTTAAPSAGKPNLYWMLDKTGSVPTNITLEGLKAMGARPRQLDEKNFTVSWVPTVLQQMLNVPGGSTTGPWNKPITSPWLTSNSLNLGHLGLYWYMDQTNAVAGQTTYNVEVEVQFAYKKPLITNATSDVAAVPAIIPHLNRSPDGIVGGNDGV